jgi:hypothetical protein
MIEPVEQTPFQETEAHTPGSLARTMLALLIREERRCWRDLQDQVRAHAGNYDSEAVASAQIRWIESRNCAEKARRVLYGWEQ